MSKPNSLPGALYLAQFQWDPNGELLINLGRNTWKKFYDIAAGPQDGSVMVTAVGTSQALIIHQDTNRVSNNNLRLAFLISNGILQAFYVNKDGLNLWSTVDGALEAKGYRREVAGIAIVPGTGNQQYSLLPASLRGLSTSAVKDCTWMLDSSSESLLTWQSC